LSKVWFSPITMITCLIGVAVGGVLSANARGAGTSAIAAALIAMTWITFRNLGCITGTSIQVCGRKGGLRSAK
jgi:hypothetical protein